MDQTLSDKLSSINQHLNENDLLASDKRKIRPQIRACSLAVEYKEADDSNTDHKGMWDYLWLMADSWAIQSSNSFNCNFPHSDKLFRNYSFSCSLRASVDLSLEFFILWQLVFFFVTIKRLLMLNPYVWIHFQLLKQILISVDSI